MKVNRIEPLMLALALAVGVLGCKTNPYGVTKLPDGSTTSGNPKDLPPGGQINPNDNPAGSQPIAESNKHSDWIQDRAPLAADTVHFDYDSTVIKTKDKPKIAAVADYLKGNSAKAVLVEGHCDERGTDEYNRALGVRRAGAIREELVRLGIGGDRLDTLRFGRDQPVDNGHSEASPAKNRRGEFVVLTSPK